MAHKKYYYEEIELKRLQERRQEALQQMKEASYSIGSIENYNIITAKVSQIQEKMKGGTPQTDHIYSVSTWI